MASSSTAPPQTRHVEEQTEASPGEENASRPSNMEPQYTELAKETLAMYEGHDADIPSNEGYVLDARGELKRRQSIASHRRKTDEHIGAGAATTDVEKGSEEVSAEEDEANIVWWDGPEDLQNPMNFSTWRKMTTIGLVSGICFVTPLASSMFAPGVPQLMAEFKSTNIELASFVVSVYILGFAVGPLVFAPLSEIFGRLPIYHFCNLGFCVFTIACAKATNLNMLIGFRFLEGVFGSAPLTNGGGTIADIIVQEKRGLAMSLFAMGPIIGPVIGPLCGGFLAQAKGWRWIFWLLTMISGTFFALSVVFMKETYAAVILQRKTLRLQKETGNLELRSKLDVGLSPRDFFVRSIVRPTKMLIFSPIVLATSLYVGVVYGYLYLLFTTFTNVFEGTYGFSSGSVGLSFMGMGVGSLLGLLYFAWSSDRLLKKRTAQEDLIAAAAGEPSQGMKPEYRLPPLVQGAVLIPAGLLLYGWTAEYHVHYIVPIMSTALIGAGNLAVFMVITTYLVDAYTVYAASALAANTVMRSVLGSVLPLAGQKMYDTLGLGWGNSLLAFIAIGMLPLPWILMKYGERLRKKFELKDL